MNGATILLVTWVAVGVADHAFPVGSEHPVPDAQQLPRTEHEGPAHRNRISGLAASDAAALDTLSLSRVLRLALELEPSLAAARAGAGGAAAELRVAEAARLPSLGSWAQAVRFEEPMVVAPIHAFDPTRPPDFDRTLIQGSLDAAYTLWDGGARAARIDGARASRAAREAIVSSTEQDALLEAVDAYLAVLTTRDIVAAQAARRAELESERDRVTRFLAEGTAPRLELLRAEAELSAAAADEVAAGARLERAEFHLASLLELPPGDLADTALRDVTVDGSGGEAAPALERHPALVAAGNRLAAARAGVRLSEASWIPRVRANAALLEYGGASADYSGEWQVGLRLEYPLFTGGARSGEADAALARAREVEADSVRIHRELERAADAARSAEREALARAASLTDAVIRFEELARVEELALEEGVGVQRDFLRAQAGLLQSRAALADARRAVVLARTRLARALGQLTLEWTDQILEPVS